MATPLEVNPQDFDGDLNLLKLRMIVDLICKLKRHFETYYSIFVLF